MSEMAGRCETCKHWFWWPGYEHRANGQWAPCNSPKENDTSEDGFSIGNSIDSYLCTGRLFGCIHQEPKT